MNIMDPTYLLLYFVVAISAVSNSFSRDRVLKFISYCFTTLLITAFVAFRWEIGTDWDAYYDLFKSIAEGFAGENVEHFDLGFVFINYVISLINDSYTFFLICTTILSTILVSYILFKYSETPHLGQLLFLGTYLPIHFTGSIRRSIAIAFIFSCVILLFEIKSKKLSILSLLFAILQHKTAVVGALFYIIPKHRFSIKLTSIIVVIASVLGAVGVSDILLTLIKNMVPENSEIGFFITISNYAGEYYKEYAPQNVDPVLLSTISLAKKIIYLLFFNLALKRKSSQLDDVMYNLYVVGVGLYSLLIGAMVIQVLAIYFLFFEVMLVSRSFTRLLPIEKGMFLLYILLSSFMSFYAGLSVYPELFFPYKSIFSL